MDSSLSTLGFVIFGITFSVYAVTVASQPQNVSRHPPPPLTPSSPPPPSLSSPSSPLTPPPTLSSRSPRSPTLSPPISSPPPPSRSSSSFYRKPSPRHSPPPPDNAQKDRGSKARNSPTSPIHQPNRRPPPLLPARQMNRGKTIGLLFAGIAGIMQIGVVGFLVFKRRQLLKTKDIFEATA